MKTKIKTTTTTKIPFITSLISSIITIKPIIMLVFIVAIGIFISTTSKKNIQEGIRGISQPTISTNFFNRSPSLSGLQPIFPEELQQDTSKRQQQQRQQQQQQQDTSKRQDTSKIQERQQQQTDMQQEQTETKKSDQTQETVKNLKEIIFSILVPLETVINLPDKTNIKIN